MHFGRCGGGAPQRKWGQRAAWRVPLPSVPLLGSGCSRFVSRPMPQRVGEGLKKWCAGKQAAHTWSLVE